MKIRLNTGDKWQVFSGHYRQIVWLERDWVTYKSEEGRKRMRRASFHKWICINEAELQYKSQVVTEFCV